MASIPSHIHFQKVFSEQPNIVQLTSSVLYTRRKCNVQRKRSGLKASGNRPLITSWRQYQEHSLAVIPNIDRNLRSHSGSTVVVVPEFFLILAYREPVRPTLFLTCGYASYFFMMGVRNSNNILEVFRSLHTIESYVHMSTYLRFSDILKKRGFFKGIPKFFFHLPRIRTVFLA